MKYLSIRFASLVFAFCLGAGANMVFETHSNNVGIILSSEESNRVIRSVAENRPSLAEITHSSKEYDGKIVEVIDYVQLWHFDESAWELGDFDKKSEYLASVILDFGEKNNTSLLHSDLKKNLSARSFNRVKVLVKGRVRDNCNIPGVSGCCFGRTMTIDVIEIRKIGNIENYQSRKEYWELFEKRPF